MSFEADVSKELAKRTSLRPGLCILDVASGLGGSGCFLATEHHCKITGIDFIQEYIGVANTLVDLSRLNDRVNFCKNSALGMPFYGSAFDVVWSEHAQMNIADKRAFYAEIGRVLKPGGRLAFHDICESSGDPLHFSVPWAEDGSISFLALPETVRDLLGEVGFKIVVWEDKTCQSLEWYAAVAKKFKPCGPPPLGLYLLMGNTAKGKFENMIRNLQEGRIVVVQAVAKKD